METFRWAAKMQPVDFCIITVSQPEWNLLESTMKNTIRRILIGAILFSLIAGIVVSIIGLKAEGGKLPIQFSDGFFWAGALMIFIGLISYQGYSQRPREESMVSVGPG